MPDIMTVKNPTCDRVSYEFADYLNDMAEDFDVRYCNLVVTPVVKSHLERVIADGSAYDAKVARLLLDCAKEQGWREEDDWYPSVEIMIG